ncbi:helix-turn-helix transcriptional regulator [Phytohabitans rumicis]|uniref:Helix-turn-helix transcriptional regulator n=2 Tax=Phytohabitans rumicis TaxID=1076125 RepID=A0A6V8KX49_9ACTN|nr:helix-turn-helix transcriptional regulator [Phytohabitans rumicis]
MDPIRGTLPLMGDYFERRDWGRAYEDLARLGTPGAADLERLAIAAYLTGHDEESDDAWLRAHQEFLRLDDGARAARCAFWLAFGLMLRGEDVRAGGWLARAQRLLDEGGEGECAERGYLLVPVALGALDADPPAAYASFARAREIGARFGEPDLVAIGTLGCGEAMVRAGKTAEGVALLDEAMVAVTAGEVSPRIAGIVYCAVLLECHAVFDLRRAREWTVALTRWCDTQRDLVPFRGQCLVHRAQLMQLQGEWPDALDEARHACERLADRPAAAMAYYQLAEVHRLRGEFPVAEEAYREASRRGYRAQPGLALLRLAQGEAAVAAAAMRTVMDQAGDRITRSYLLSAHVEVMLAADDVPAARAAATELAELADDLDTPYVRAVSAHAAGAVCLAAGDAKAAVATLRRAWTLWRELDAPYDAARARVLIGLACRALGDHDGATLELDAAAWAFRKLGAAPDLSGVERLAVRATPPGGPLTPREVEVLRLVAAGKSNRVIAADLFLSEKTVARHVSNILGKLGLPSRSAATGYAYEHGLT